MGYDRGSRIGELVVRQEEYRVEKEKRKHRMKPPKDLQKDKEEIREGR